MMFDPVWSPPLDGESHNERQHDNTDSNSSRNTSPTGEGEGLRDDDVPLGINRTYHPTINGLLFFFNFLIHLLIVNLYREHL